MQDNNNDGAREGIQTGEQHLRLYHFSEEPDIEVFKPRQLSYRMDEPAQIWTIDEFHAPHYYFPRDCPRICIWADQETSEQNLERFFRQTSKPHIIAIESKWFVNLTRTVLYQYEFEPEGFHLYEENAGYYTSFEEQKPVNVIKLTLLHEQIFSLGIELRVTPSLQPLREDILRSGLGSFSMIRMKNAAKA